ncbi:hypothetical protein SNEBB_006506 [Seison nebaliae]|nr:hypothetical protein SNEBB_006506 [Seison nebaliae]
MNILMFNFLIIYLISSHKNIYVATRTHYVHTDFLQNARNLSEEEENSLSTNVTKILDKLLEGYDRRLRPNFGSRPVEINITIQINSIHSMSEVGMSYSLDLYLRQYWNDRRLSFEPIIKDKYELKEFVLSTDILDKIWWPDTFFATEKRGELHQLTTSNRLLRITHTGDVLLSMRLTVESTCNMDLRLFPMDTQRCTLEIESYGHETKDMYYRWVDNKLDILETSLPQFNLTHYRQEQILITTTTGNYSRLITTLVFKRRIGYYLIQIYVPAILIVIMSWKSFWIERTASPARVSLGITTVLTMTTLMSTINNQLPKISYMKSIDIFLTTCFVMVFMSLAEYATVSVVHRRNVYYYRRKRNKQRLLEQNAVVPSTGYQSANSSSQNDAPKSSHRLNTTPVHSITKSKSSKQENERKNSEGTSITDFLTSAGELTRAFFGVSSPIDDLPKKNCKRKNQFFSMRQNRRNKKSAPNYSAREEENETTENSYPTSPLLVHRRKKKSSECPNKIESTYSPFIQPKNMRITKNPQNDMMSPRELTDSPSHRHSPQIIIASHHPPKETDVENQDQSQIRKTTLAVVRNEGGEKPVFAFDTTKQIPNNNNNNNNNNLNFVKNSDNINRIVVKKESNRERLPSEHLSRKCRKSPLKLHNNNDGQSTIFDETLIAMDHTPKPTKTYNLIDIAPTSYTMPNHSSNTHLYHKQPNITKPKCAEAIYANPFYAYFNEPPPPGFEAEYYYYLQKIQRKIRKQMSQRYIPPNFRQSGYSPYHEISKQQLPTEYIPATLKVTTANLVNINDKLRNNHQRKLPEKRRSSSSPYSSRNTSAKSKHRTKSDMILTKPNDDQLLTIPPSVQPQDLHKTNMSLRSNSSRNSNRFYRNKFKAAAHQIMTQNSIMDYMENRGGGNKIRMNEKNIKSELRSSKKYDNDYRKGIRHRLLNKLTRDSPTSFGDEMKLAKRLRERKEAMFASSYDITDSGELSYDTDDDQKPYMKNDPSKFQKFSLFRCKLRRIKASFIDINSRIAFPLAFLCFNIGYWFYYYPQFVEDEMTYQKENFIRVNPV